MLVVNMSDWGKILAAFDGVDIPLVWCNKPHPPARLTPRGRTVIVLPAYHFFREELKSHYNQMVSANSTTRRWDMEDIWLLNEGPMEEMEFQRLLDRLRNCGVRASCLE